MNSSVLRFTFLFGLAAAAVQTDPAPRALLLAKIEGPPGQSVPLELAVRVRPSLQLVGQETLGWESEISCPVREGRWQCPIPAGRVDLRITGAAVRPIYRWGVTVDRGGRVDLGTLRLWRGGSITGSVQPEGKIPQHAVRVDLLPLDVGGPTAGEGAKPLRTTTFESTSRPWGFFHFEGMPPGRYIVRVQDLDLPTLRSNVIDFEGDRPIELPPFLLKKVPFSVRIDPPKGPAGAAWRVRLSSWPLIPGEPMKLLEGRPSPSGGLWRFSDLAPGFYAFSVSTHSGRQPEATWYSQQLPLDARTPPAEVRLPFVRVRGRVLYRDRPLKATLSFRHETSAFTLFSNEAGELDGFLADVGSWTVRVNAPGLAVTLQDPLVIPKAQVTTQVEIRVPDTALTAEVVDAQGRRVPKAAIDVMGEPRNLFNQDDQQSSSPVQQILGLKAGSQRVRAAQQHPLRVGEPVEVELHEGERAPHLRLRLPDVTVVRGRVLPRFGYATGARLFARPLDASTGVEVEADEDGDFEVALPGGTRKIQLVVLPPGNALRILETAVGGEKPVEIPVPRAGGTLIVEGPGALVEIPEPKKDEPLKRPLPVLFRLWADLQATPQTPGRLVVPNVEPGTYSICPGSPFSLRRGEAKEGETGCRSGTLQVAGELVLRVPG